MIEVSSKFSRGLQSLKYKSTFKFKHHKVFIINLNIYLPPENGSATKRVIEHWVSKSYQWGQVCLPEAA